MKLTVMAWIIAILLETEFCINVWQARCCCEVIIWIRHTNTKSVPQTCHEEYVYDYASPKWAWEGTVRVSMKAHVENVWLHSNALKTLVWSIMLSFQIMLWDGCVFLDVDHRKVHLSETLENSMDAFKTHIKPLYGLKLPKALNVATAVMNYIFECQVHKKLSKNIGRGHQGDPQINSELLQWQ